MAYTPREIKDRVAVGDDIFLVEDLGNNRIRLTPTPTHVLEAGTPINKALLQPIEDFLATLGTGGIIPPGGIIMWSGAVNAIPEGWALCDGSNGTPDLRNRFIVGAGGSYNVGNTGGSNRVTLTTSQLPAHNHTASSSSTGAHTHSISTSSAGSHSHGAGTYQTDTYNPPEQVNYADSFELRKMIAMGDLAGVDALTQKRVTVQHSHAVIGTSDSAGSHTHSGTAASAGSHSHSITVNNTGSGSSHENRPPYYALCFIMKL